MSNQISVEVILLVIVVCGTYYVTHKTQHPIPSEYREPPREVPDIRIQGDDRYSIAPRPVRVEPGLPSIPSRGMPDAYQQMGILDGGDGKLLPLYGRRVAPRSDYFNYYTRTDTYNPVAVPIRIKRRDCQDSVGCPEVFNGDHVDTVTGMKAKVTLYGFDGPRYEP